MPKVRSRQRVPHRVQGRLNRLCALGDAREGDSHVRVRQAVVVRWGEACGREDVRIERVRAQLGDLASLATHGVHLRGGGAVVSTCMLGEAEGPMVWAPC
jgi:hypothetical protein